MRPARWRTAVLAVALVVAGCGATPPPPSASASAAASVATSLGIGDPCALLADVAGAVGREPIASPAAYEVGATRRCMWVVARDPSRSVGLSVGPAANHAATMDAFGAGESVSGLGDDARWWPAARTLSVALGDESFQVDLELDDAEATRDVAIGLARQALEAIGSGG